MRGLKGQYLELLMSDNLKSSIFVRSRTAIFESIGVSIFWWRHWFLCVGLLVKVGEQQKQWRRITRGYHVDPARETTGRVHDERDHTTGVHWQKLNLEWKIPINVNQLCAEKKRWMDRPRSIAAAHRLANDFSIHRFLPRPLQPIFWVSN